MSEAVKPTTTTPLKDDRGVPLADPFQGNPCQGARDESYNCLNKHSYDSSKCEDYFEAYKACKKLWGDRKKEYRDAKYKADRKDMWGF
eukprot:m.260182 g.260182  ORF g.260182 m.260182 type:complete len:88 (-) comp39366_c0_seq1:74-337(-)